MFPVIFVRYCRDMHIFVIAVCAFFAFARSRVLRFALLCFAFLPFLRCVFVVLRFCVFVAFFVAFLLRFCCVFVFVSVFCVAFLRFRVSVLCFRVSFCVSVSLRFVFLCFFGGCLRCVFCVFVFLRVFLCIDDSSGLGVCSYRYEIGPGDLRAAISRERRYG